MAYSKTCPNCELYGGCASAGVMPKDERGCDEWELAFSIYQDMTKEEIREYLKEITEK